VFPCHLQNTSHTCWAAANSLLSIYTRFVGALAELIQQRLPVVLVLRLFELGERGTHHVNDTRLSAKHQPSGSSFMPQNHCVRQPELRNQTHWCAYYKLVRNFYVP